MNLNRLHIQISTIACVAIFALYSSVNAHAFSTTHYADSSKLATGKWVKIKVTKSGMHAITSADAQKWGFSDISKLHIFGFGGAPISEKLSEDLPDDLPQIPVVRSGGKIIFYAQGPTTWKNVDGKVNFTPVQHPYATAGYYFVTDDAKYTDIAVAKASNVATGPATSTYTERVFHEEELVNPGETGRLLLGEDFRYNKSQTFKFSLPGYISGTNVNVLTSFASKTMGGNSKLTFQQNGTNIPGDGTDNIGAVLDVAHTHYAWGSSVKSFVPNNGENLSYTVTYNPSGTVYLARLNHIAVNYERALALQNGTVAWGQHDGKAESQIEVSGVTDETQVWDVTTSHLPTEMNVTKHDGKAVFSPIISGNFISKYIVCES